MTSVLVTGARGFAGGYLANLLARSGCTVTGWRRPGPGAEPDPFFESAITWQDVDLLDRDAVVDAIASSRPSEVYHCAGAAHVGESFANISETLAANVMGTHHLLDGLRNAGLRARVLITGTSLVYRQSDRPLTETDPVGPATPYAISKLAQEMLGLRGIHEDGQDVLIARSFNHTGPRQSPSYVAPGFARQIALIENGHAEPVILVGNLDASRDIHDVRDTVRAYRDIVRSGRPGDIYNVCAGQAFRIRTVLDRLVAMSKARLSIRIDPARQRPSDNPVVWGDRGRIERQIGWVPEVSLDTTLADLLDHWRKAVE